MPNVPLHQSAAPLQRSPCAFPGIIQKKEERERVREPDPQAQADTHGKQDGKYNPALPRVQRKKECCPKSGKHCSQLQGSGKNLHQQDLTGIFGKAREQIFLLHRPAVHKPQIDALQPVGEQAEEYIQRPA